MTPERPNLTLLRRRLADGKSIPAKALAALEADPRAGAQALLKAVKSKQAKNRGEGQRLRHMLKFETELWEQGHTLIAGVDEAGMAPLAGPVVAGAAILPKGYKLKGLDDSKKILSEEKREELAQHVKRDALAWAVGWASVEEVDTINIYHAGLLAMRRAVEGLSLKPDFVLVDARTIPQIPFPQRGIIKGDALSLSIAAGAILAKTTRDQHMSELGAKHPEYGFEDHKGYPTPVHLAALEKHGVLPFHRRSFAPVRVALGLVPQQEELFMPALVEGKAPKATRSARR